MDSTLSPSLDMGFQIQSPAMLYATFFQVLQSGTPSKWCESCLRLIFGYFKSRQIFLAWLTWYCCAGFAVEPATSAMCFATFKGARRSIRLRSVNVAYFLRRFHSIWTSKSLSLLRCLRNLINLIFLWDVRIYIIHLVHALPLQNCIWTFPTLGRPGPFRGMV